MSELFATLGIAGSGVTTYRTWLDALSDNISNINTVRPTSAQAFQARYVVAQANGDGSSDSQRGVHVAGVALGNATGRMTYEPDNPLADPRGYVRRPDIDLGEQMTQLIMAQRGYQANLSVIDRVRDAYQQAIQLGRNS